MAIIETINSAINGVVWGVPMLVLLVGAGILLTIRTFGVQFRKFGYAMKNTLGKVFTKAEAKEGEMTPFQAMSTALAGTVGTGNIAGITTAITLGGPGTMFWLWITALIGMATKYSEVLLAVRFRERNKDGDWVGGPMYYIKNGLGKNWKWLGAIFCIFAALAAFGIGNAVQVGNITSSINTVIAAFNPDFDKQSLVNIVLGIILVILTSVVLFGGIKRLGAVTEKLVPIMAVIYIVACLIVVIRYANTLPCSTTSSRVPSPPAVSPVVSLAPWSWSSPGASSAACSPTRPASVPLLSPMLLPLRPTASSRACMASSRSSWTPS